MKKQLLIIVLAIFSVVIGGAFSSFATERIVGNEYSVEKIKPKVAIRAHPFNLKQVRLLDGPFKEAMERDRKYLHRLDADRLLHNFRVNAGLASSAKPLGGWEGPNVELRGHTVGHYLSACALMYASTGDERLKNKADYIVRELAKCQRSLGKTGYLSAYPESFIDRVEAGKPVWAPWYTLHKIYAGLLDMYIHCGNKQALEVVEGMAVWAKMRTDRLNEEQMQRMLRNEFGGMNEVFANLYAVTGNPDHLLLAQRFDHKVIFEPLLRHEDRLKGLHANTQIPKIIGAAREYEMAGDKRYYEVATFFWDEVVDCRMYSIGGTSNFEHWRTEPCVLAEEISVESAETCCTYNMLKLTRHLFQWSAQPKYADYYERALYNQILASQSPENGMMMYYVAMKPGHFKVFNLPNESFWCCTGTGLENHAKYGNSIYFYDDEDLFVNLFIASELKWTEKELAIRQETKFPERDNTTLIIKAKKPTKIAVRIRIPYWATNGVMVKINGEPQEVTAVPSSYLTLQRIWKDGDTIEVTMPMSLHLHRMPDDASVVCIMYGPLVLGGELGTEKLTHEMQYVANQRSQHNAPSIEVPHLITDNNDVNAWVKPVLDKALTFRTVNVGRPYDVTLVPFYKLYGQRYSIYWSLNTEQKYVKILEERKKQREKEAAEKAARQKKIAEQLVDSVKIADELSEREHNLQVKDSYSGEYAQKNWRDARGGGWFSYDMKVLPDVPMTLECTYWGNDAGRTFEILVDDVSLGTVEIEEGHRDKFFYKEYKIPFEATKSEKLVTVKFKAPEQGFAGGVFGLLILKEK